MKTAKAAAVLADGTVCPPLARPLCRLRQLAITAPVGSSLLLRKREAAALVQHIHRQTKRKYSTRREGNLRRVYFLT